MVRGNYCLSDKVLFFVTQKKGVLKDTLKSSFF